MIPHSRASPTAHFANGPLWPVPDIAKDTPVGYSGLGATNEKAFQ
jgi:hypothetical protein